MPCIGGAGFSVGLDAAAAAAASSSFCPPPPPPPPTEAEHCDNKSLSNRTTASDAPAVFDAAAAAVRAAVGVGSAGAANLTSLWCTVVVEGAASWGGIDTAHTCPTYLWGCKASRRQNKAPSLQSPLNCPPAPTHLYLTLKESSTQELVKVAVEVAVEVEVQVQVEVEVEVRTCAAYAGTLLGGLHTILSAFDRTAWVRM